MSCWRGAVSMGWCLVESLHGFHCYTVYEKVYFIWWRFYFCVEYMMFFFLGMRMLSVVCHFLFLVQGCC